jgi:TusA-related sulfurtransferase
MKENLVDARGRSCPEPALLTRRALLNAGKGTVIVLVDSVTARDNVVRTASLAGWQSAAEQQSDGSYRLTLTQ